MPIHIDEVQSEVQVQSPRRGGGAAAERASVPGQAQADWLRLQRQAQADRARTSAWGNDTGDGPDGMLD